MTEPHRAIFGSGRLRVVEVVFCCDLSKVEAPTIPLGVMVDARAGGWYGLGLHARTSISPTELRQVGRLAAAAIACPADLFKQDFDSILESGNPVSAFSLLPYIHRASLLAVMTTDQKFDLPKAIARCDEEEKQRAHVEDVVRVHAADAYRRLITKSTNPSPPFERVCVEHDRKEKAA